MSKDESMSRRLAATTEQITLEVRYPRTARRSRPRP